MHRKSRSFCTSARNSLQTPSLRQVDLRKVSQRFHITLSSTQYDFLSSESTRSSVSVAELIRRAIDATYGPSGAKRVSVITHTLGRRSGLRVRD